MQNIKIVLLGHTGFIGKKVFNQLKLEKITVLGISSKKINFLKSNSPEKLKRYLSRDTILIVAIAITRELGDTLQTLEDNIKIITNVARSLEIQKIKKCVYLSTADVYGIPEKLPITENTPIAPKTYYAAAKYACEQILQVTTKKTRSPFLIFRYNGVFGPGQKNIGYGPNAFVDSILKERVIRFWGNGEELRDSVYVEDLARIITSLSLNKATGIYNIATGKSRSYRKMVTILEKIADEKFNVIKQKRTGPAFNQIFDISKLRDSLPNIRFTDFETATRQTYIIARNI